MPPEGKAGKKVDPSKQTENEGPQKIHAALGKVYIPKLGTYIPKLGTYISKLGMYIPKFGI